MDLSHWLQGLGLERYEQKFRDHDVDAAVLRELTADDLADLGVRSIGHRRRLLAAIAALRDTPSQPPPREPAGVPERRQVTVLFCDLVGSTALSSRLDPEEMREVIRAYQTAVLAEVQRFAGHVLKLMGDGVLACFGWPRAQEDAAERAVRAGLGAVGAVALLRAPDGRAMSARVGIATGLVVVGDLVGEGVAREEAIVGETPNLAARLQAAAEAGEVVIGEGVRRLVGGLFDLGDLGLKELKGFAAPVRAYAVLGEARGIESRFDALKGSDGLAPLIGRERELDLLLRSWRAATDGAGGSVTVIGEPGIGKSRLARALVELVVAVGPVTVLRYFCSPYHISTALFPVVEQLQRAAAFENDDAPSIKLAKLRALLARAVADPAPSVPLLATLLGLPATGCYRPPDLTPAALKARTLAALLDQLKGLTRAGPVLVLFEDLHWADPTTTELLAAVAAAAPHLAVLLLATARPEFRPPWPEGGTATTLALGRLDRRQSAAMLQRLAGAKGLPEALETDILAKTDGVPLFLEELTKAVLETGWLTDAGDRYELNRPLPTLNVPDTLQGSLMARLDRLAGPKLVAQVGAVIGRDFDRALLGAVADVPKAELDAALAVLEESGLVQRRGEPPAATYSFKHALVRDAAYESLLRSRRQALHGRIVQAIERDFPQLATSQPELVAHHCAGAGLIGQAVRYGRQAGEQAVRRAANIEAIAHFRRALACNEALPESEERSRATLGMLAQLGPALMSVQGWPAPEVGEVFERAGEVAQGLERSVELTPPLVGLWLFHVARGQFERAEAISGKLFEIARELDDPDVLLQAHHAAWPTHWLRGTCRAAADHIDAGLALYDERRHERHRYLYLGHDPAVCALAIGAPVAWMMGETVRAGRLEREALDLARRLRHAPSLAHALWFVGEAQVARGDAEAAMATAAELLALCDEHKLPQPRATGLMFQGWALARAGETTLGTARVREGLGIWHRLGARSYLPRAHYLLAECHLLAGCRADGLGEVARALAVAAETGERWCVARMHALRADLLLQGADAAGAEASMRTALGVAREQGAKGWELGAATSLARLLAERGEREQAHDLLAPVRAAFPPGGLDGPDLRAAEAVLASLR